MRMILETPHGADDAASCFEAGVGASGEPLREVLGPVTYRQLSGVEISKIVDLGGPQLANQNLGGDYPLLPLILGGCCPFHDPNVQVGPDRNGPEMGLF